MADSITRSFHSLRNTDVETRRGAKINEVHDFLLETSKACDPSYDVILLHVGTNWLGVKYEWGLYLAFVNGCLTYRQFRRKMIRLNPRPAFQSANLFRAQYTSLINYIQSVSSAPILISAILPRPWDFDRREHLRRRYNRILRSFHNPPHIYFIATDAPFIRRNVLRVQLFCPDGFLNTEGTKVLQSYFMDKIRRARTGRLVYQPQILY